APLPDRTLRTGRQDGRDGTGHQEFPGSQSALLTGASVKAEEILPETHEGGQTETQSARGASAESAFDADLVVIGGGSGGIRAARIAANHGARVVLAEADRLG